MSGEPVVGAHVEFVRTPQAVDSRAWIAKYLRRAGAVDAASASAAGFGALLARYVSQGRHLPMPYLGITLGLPLLWCAMVAIAGGYDARFIGVGSDEFRRILNTSVSLMAVVALFSYSARIPIARGYVIVALPGTTAIDLIARFLLRKRLHRRRHSGACMHRTVAVGHAAAVADLIRELRRDTYHGLSIVAVCLAERSFLNAIDGVPVCGGLDRVSETVAAFGADTVSILACRELNGVRLRELAWALEATGTDLYVAPALMDVAGPRTTISPVAGLPLLHVDHPELAGIRQVIKTVFDRLTAISALLLMSPILLAIALRIRVNDRGPAIFRQTRVGKDGRTFTLYKFRTMVMDAEQQKPELAALSNGAGLLFKMRRDPRVTKPGIWLRRWSLDELPQLFNVLRGEMSLVGPRPALPDEAARYGYYVRRRLAVKPGMTGLWQIKGRSDLPWDEAVRLDLRYVENWSLALDLQILWKTLSAVRRGSGAY